MRKIEIKLFENSDKTKIYIILKTIISLIITFTIISFLWRDGITETNAAPASSKVYKKYTTVLSTVKYCDDGIQLKWKKIPNTKGYYIYRREDNGQWEKYDTVGKKRKYIDYSTETGVAYEYAVQGYTYYRGKTIVTKKSYADIIMIGLPDRVQGVDAKYVGTTQTDIKWKKSEEASGYYIYRQIGIEPWEKIAEIKNPDIYRYTDNIIECKKTYKYRVVPYEIIDAVLYTGYTDVTPANAYSDTGIDVSYHNGKIKWSKVKADGIDFAFIRIGRGEPSKKSGAVLDEKFHRNMKNARKYNVEVGVYFYSCARTVSQAKKEANFVVKNLKEYGQLDLPVVYDFESMYRRGKIYKDKNTKMIDAFCKIISTAGYETLIYSDNEMLTKYTDHKKLSKYGFWVAYWTYDPTRCPIELDNVYYWQYSDKGRFDGIKTYTDKNVRLIN